MASPIRIVADHVSVVPTPSITPNNAMIFFVRHSRSVDGSQPTADQLGTLRLDRFFYLNREILSSPDNRYRQFLFGILSMFDFCSDAYCGVLRQLLSLDQNPDAWTGDIDIVVHERILAAMPRVSHDQPSDSSFLERLKAKGDGEVGEGEICPVCIDDLRGSKAVVELPCLHLFHRDCVSAWFTRSPTCPLCRYNIIRSS